MRAPVRRPTQWPAAHTARQLRCRPLRARLRHHHAPARDINTVDTAHALVRPEMSRDLLYVAMTPRPAIQHRLRVLRHPGRRRARPRTRTSPSETCSNRSSLAAARTSPPTTQSESSRSATPPSPSSPPNTTRPSGTPPPMDHPRRGHLPRSRYDRDHSIGQLASPRRRLAASRGRRAGPRHRSPEIRRIVAGRSRPGDRRTGPRPVARAC